MFVCFLIAGPALLASFILRDQRERSWVPLLVVGALGFLIGGAIAGRHRRTKRGAIEQGVGVAILTASVIVLADIIRCLVLGKGFSLSTLGLWIGVEVGSIILASIGGLIGRNRYLRSRMKKASAL
jgi:hypothetical protein